METLVLLVLVVAASSQKKSSGAGGSTSSQQAQTKAAAKDYTLADYGAACGAGGSIGGTVAGPGGAVVGCIGGLLVTAAMDLTPSDAELAEMYAEADNASPGQNWGTHAARGSRTARYFL